MKPMATPTTTIRRRRLAIVASGLALTLAAVAIMRQPTEPVRTHLYGQTYMHMEGDWVVYTYDDIDATCRYKPADWQKPVCEGIEQ